MKALDPHRMASDKVPFDLSSEVALRSLYTFVLVLLFFEMIGRRGARQTSLFEVLITLILGSAARGVAFYNDMPTVSVLIAFITLVLLYRPVMWLMAHSEKLEDLLKGKPVVVTEDGKPTWSKLSSSNMTELKFFVELRPRGVEQLGQVRLAILETNGQISVHFFGGDKARPGLLISLSDYVQRYKAVSESADYAYVRCSEIIHMNARKKQLCPHCADPEWTKTGRAKRMT